jgi:hypothetical protein
MPSFLEKSQRGGEMPPFDEDEFAPTEPGRLVIHPRVFGGVNLLLQAVPIMVWDAFHTRISFHAATAVWDSLDLLLDGVEIDRGRNRVTVIRHMRGRQSRPLSDFEHLLIDRINEGHYTLSLVGSSEPFDLLAFRRYLDTRHSAERIATYLGCDIRDEALGPRILSRRSQAEKPPANDSEERSSERALGAGTDETVALLLHHSENEADVLRIDYDGDPRKTAMIAIPLLLSAAAGVVFAYLFQAMMPALAIAAAASMAVAILLLLYRRRGVIFVRDADWCIAWRFFRSRHFARQLPLSRYREVILHAEERVRGEDVNPYAERDEGTLSYAVCLDGQAELLEIRLASDIASARKLAARVAKFVGLEFRDFTR